MTVTGIDIASYQSSTFTTTGIGFVMVKATEGTGYTNPRHAAQVAHTRAAGAVVGHYHFLHPGSAKAQAAYFVQQAQIKPGDILACDWEPTTSGLATTADKDTFIREVKRLAPRDRVILYCDLARWKGVDTTSYAGDGLWIADPGAPVGKPRVDHAWMFHQYGIKGTDLDVGNFPSRAALVAWAYGTKPPAPPAPKPKPPAALTPAKTVHLKVAIWTATHSLLDERKFPQNEPQVYAIQLALVAHHHLEVGHFMPGIFDTPTKNAYAAEQEAQGFHGRDADGIPGPKSLTTLGRGRFTEAA
jgi:Lyzozyme M1 (1,4-beta-N-acetylmuramidase)